MEFFLFQNFSLFLVLCQCGFMLSRRYENLNIFIWNFLHHARGCLGYEWFSLLLYLKWKGLINILPQNWLFHLMVFRWSELTGFCFFILTLWLALIKKGWLKCFLRLLYCDCWRFRIQRSACQLNEGQLIRFSCVIFLWLDLRVLWKSVHCHFWRLVS